MPAPSDRPLRKCTLNLFEDSVAELVRIYGNGWTAEVRRAVDEFIKRRHEAQQSLEDSFR